MLPIEREVQKVKRFDSKGRPALTLYLDTDPSHGAGRNVKAQIQDALRPIRFSLSEDADGRQALLAAADLALAEIAGLESVPRAMAVFACPELRFLRVLPLPEPMGKRAHWGPELHLGPLLTALDEHERTVVVLVDQERAHVFRIFMGQIEEVAHFAEELPKHGQGGHGQQKFGGGIHGGTIGMGYGEPNLQRRHEWHVRKHLERVLPALRLNGSPAPVDRYFLGGGEETVLELLRLLPKRIRDRTWLLPGISVDATPATVLARVIQTQREAEREEEEELVDNLTERDRARSVFGATAVTEAVSDDRVHTLVYTETDLEGSECGVCGWLVPGAAPASCPRCGGEMRSLADLVERLVTRVIRAGGRVEEVRGPARETLLRWEGLAALLRYVPPSAGQSPSAREGPVGQAQRFPRPA